MTDYDDAISDRYDDWYSLDFDGAAEAVDLLAGYGRGGALELGVGTGRVAIPLAARGIAVHGIDTSRRMLERLRGKPGGERVRTQLADMSDFALPERFSVVFSVFNTLFCLTCQRQQVACFAAAARHLAPGGRFVVDTALPSAWDGRQPVQHIHSSDHELRLSVVQTDQVTQVMDRQVLVCEQDGFHRYRSVIRYVTPGEMDLMALMAGLTLEERWAAWSSRPVAADSRRCVSVYRVDACQPGERP